ncbi:BTAD domain-containing putative transcriptional regulator [Paractinoplanes rishiriensis]|uniref:SARP family transcriptional regulator n=1 Tax=Paractinoplanes rishiriensis TaxID=1050105 RepID=A0A919JXE3_9ACTN|nr:BTAD domain-containing putative transcriptional regulator [Actinoplanes rishiriensis]GIE95252.1 SARP family transcriptional regulator [Actinoplanes rishiriensis]
MSRIQVRLLGPVDLVVGGVTRRVSGLRRKALLAVLALDAGSVVSTDRLIDIVWDGAPPPTALNTLQRHVSRLRADFGAPGVIAGQSHGYALELPDDATDLAVAERLISEGRRAPDPAGRAARLRGALDLWRGRPLADVTGLRRLAEQAEHLEQVELAAREAFADARLALGEHAALVPELERLAARHPYREQIHGQLIVALYRSGRQADALGAYRRLRLSLADDLGVVPSPALRKLEAAVLRQDAVLDLPAAPVTVRAAGAVPAQLPVAVPGFTGRGQPIKQLDALLATDRAMVVAALCGSPGVGKSALAVHWAHQVAGSFPDGQLYVNLRGFEAEGSAVEPAAAVRGFLDAFAVPAQRIPADLEAQAALYRSVLAGKRVLVLLDNARDAAQVRPLLPAAPGCLVLITSRDQLTPLVATEGARPVPLGVLTVAEARDLLTVRLGAELVGAEPAAAGDIIERCARLPLALAVVAARAAVRPDLPLGVVAAELHEFADSLEPFDGGDPATDVRTVFSWSYRTLSVPAARLFRLLGLHPGPDISRAAVASLGGCTAAAARPLLAELTGAHLLTEHRPGRYTFHDLLRAYARSLVDAVEGHEGRRRMFDHYLHSADGAARQVDGHRQSVVADTAGPGVVPEPPADYEQALDWYTAERAVLLAVADAAARTGFDGHSWRIAWTMMDFLDIHSYWHDLIAVHTVALGAARRLGDNAGQAHAHWGLARAYAKLDRPDDATENFGHTLCRFEQAGDRTGQAQTLLNLGWVLDRQGRYPEALAYARRAMTLYEATGDLAGQADGHNTIGWYLTHLGEHQQALDHCRRAVALHGETGDRHGEAQAWDSLGRVHANLGEPGRAVDCYLRSLDLIRGLRIRYAETIVLSHLADARQAAGDRAGSRAAWRRAPAVAASRIVRLDQNGLGRYLDAHEFAGKDFNVVTRTRQSDNTQRWVLTDWGNNEYTLQQVSSGRYLDAHEIPELDYRVVTRPEQNNTTQRWRLWQHTSGYYWLESVSSPARYVDAYDYSGADYQVVTRPFNNMSHQLWRITAG